MSQPSQTPNSPEPLPNATNPSGAAQSGAAQSSKTPPPSRLQAALQIVQQLGGIVWAVMGAVLPLLFKVLKQLWQISLKLLGWLNRQWSVLLPKIRTLLPAAWNAKLPDAVLTAVAVGLLVLVLWIPTTLNRKPAVVIAPGSESEPPVAVVKPDRNAERVAAIQEKLVEVGTEYGGALVEGVRADFANSLLTVTLGNDWAALTPSQQMQLANDLLKRSKKLSFENFEITNLEGKTIARPVVVGSGMVVLMNS
jgi:hypothetical protein